MIVVVMDQKAPSRLRLISQWSIETHTSIASWGKFGPTLEDVLILAMLSMHRKRNLMGVVLEGDDKEKLQYLASVNISVWQVNLCYLVEVF